MKKIIALILSVLMVCGMLAACGDTKPQGGEVTPLPTDNKTEATTPSTEATTGEDDATKPSDEATEPSDTPTEPDVTDVSLGAIQGGVYTNKYLGVTCTLDDKWTFATAEQLQELPGNVADLFSDSELASKLGTQIFDMQAENQTDFTSMNILYQKLTAVEMLAYAGMTEEQIIDETLKEKDTMIAAYEQAGIEVSSLEKVTVTFCGKERTAILMTSTLQEVPYYTLQLFDCHLGAYSVTTTFASFNEDKTESLLTMFTVVE